MEIREFAESILFSSTLEAKLRPPGELTDLDPGSPVATPAAPARPDELHFAGRQAAFKLPTPRELEHDAARGRLLHFFANHELLATELMALALLKFPTAPKTFRAGLLRTLVDEQTHTKMYLGRLRQLGVEFGEFPVNGFFWRVIADMPTPMDYVSRLSLTFEQANLDYSRLFAERFSVIGDGASQKLMDRIYHDEIDHVGFGLEWFRQWKEPAQTDWEAYSARLQLPLSPNRAKAEPFNREGRLAAGLDSDFIEHLRVFSRSKGRTPHVFHFNPFAEAMMARSGSFTPNQRQSTLARDLEILPAFLCRKDDVVLVNELPATEFLAELTQAGFEPPEFAQLVDQQIPSAHELHARRLAGFRPWAWSPDSIALLTPLARSANCAPPEIIRWEQGFRPLYSKVTATHVLRELVASTGDPDTLIEPCDIGAAATSLDAACRLITHWRAGGHERLVAKRPHGVAGANMMRLWEPELSAAQQTWLERAISAEGAVVIEPWLDRVLDFSFQFDFHQDKLRLLGTPRMTNDLRGQYQASEYHPRFAAGLDRELAALLNGPRGGRLKRLHAALGDLLLPRLRAAGFQGALGIDAFAYRIGSQLRLKPVVEINPRYTMGRLMLELMRLAAEGCVGRLELVTPSTLKATRCDSFSAYACSLREHHPLRFANPPRRRIESGALCLNDPARATGCLAVFRVTRPR